MVTRCGKSELYYFAGGGLETATPALDSLASSGKGEEIILYDPAVPFPDIHPPAWCVRVPQKRSIRMCTANYL